MVRPSHALSEVGFSNKYITKGNLYIRWFNGYFN